jgi:hypothetical protein
MVVATWKSLKKSCRVHMNEGQNRNFEDMFIRLFFNRKITIKSISKGSLKIRSNFDPSKVNNYHLVRFLRNHI